MQLPDFPWDSLLEAKRQAAKHPGGIIDLSVGSPVDPTVLSAREGLLSGADAPGYPVTSGSPELVDAMVSWWVGERQASRVEKGNVLPVIGSKEMVALLPLLLGLKSGDAVVYPTISYPTYEVGALVAGAIPVRADSPSQWPANTKLVWVNSPSNPTGEVLGQDTLRELVAEARARGVVLASDECYALLGSSNQPVTPSVLSDAVTDGDYRGVLALHSLSKQANMAGYRAAFLAGDADIVATITHARRHLGLMVPSPIQSAVTAALADTGSVTAQRKLYQERREILRPAVEGAGFTVEHSQAGLYLWATRGENADQSVSWFAQRGVLVTPGHFYGPAGDSHVRVSLTVSTEQAMEVYHRLVPN